MANKAHLVMSLPLYVATGCFRWTLGDWCIQTMRSMWPNQSSAQERILRGIEIPMEQ